MGVFLSFKYFQNNCVRHLFTHLQFRGQRRAETATTALLDRASKERTSGAKHASE